MAQLVRFIDRPGGTVLLDVSPGTLATGVVVGDPGVQAPPPPVERVVSGSPTNEGGVVTLQPVGMRTVTVPLAYTGGLDGTPAMQARRDAVQALMRVLTREEVWLELRPDGLAESRYLHCYRSSDPDLVAKLQGLGQRWAEAVVKMPADPYAYGPQDTSLPLVSCVNSADLRALIPGASIKGEAPAPLICQFTHPGAGGSLEQFSVWVSSHHAGTNGANAKVLYDLTAAGGTLPGASTRATAVDTDSIGGSYIAWRNVPVGSPYLVSSFSMVGPAGGSIDGKGTYRAFAVLRQDSNAPASTTERWRIALRILNTSFGGTFGETEIASGDAYVRTGTTIDRIVDLGLIDVPFAGRDTAIGFEAPRAIAATSIRVYATCLDSGGVAQAATDLGFDAIVLLPADDSLALVQYVSAPTARQYYLDPHSGTVEVRDNNNLNVAHQPFVGYSGGAPYVTPGVDTSIALIRANGGFTDNLQSDTGGGATLNGSFVATYWPRYLSVT